MSFLEQLSRRRRQPVRPAGTAPATTPVPAVQQAAPLLPAVDGLAGSVLRDYNSATSTQPTNPNWR